MSFILSSLFKGLLLHGLLALDLGGVPGPVGEPVPGVVQAGGAQTLVQGGLRGLQLHVLNTQPAIKNIWSYKPLSLLNQ